MTQSTQAGFSSGISQGSSHSSSSSSPPPPPASAPSGPPSPFSSFSPSTSTAFGSSRTFAFFSILNSFVKNISSFSLKNMIVTYPMYRRNKMMASYQFIELL